MFKTIYLLAIVVGAAVPFANGCKFVSILSDLTKDEDKQFFKTTFPWLVENIGTELNVKFYFKGRGQDTGPRMCVLEEMKNNVYLQTDYVKCETEDKEGKRCKESLPINIKSFDLCLKYKARRMINAAEREFSKRNSYSTPIVILPGGKEIEKPDPKMLLKGICGIVGRNKPSGCTNPSPLPNNSNNTSSTISENETTTVTLSDTTDTTIKSDIVPNVTSALTTVFSSLSTSDSPTDDAHVSTQDSVNSFTTSDMDATTDPADSATGSTSDLSTQDSVNSFSTSDMDATTDPADSATGSTSDSNDSTNS